MLISIFPSDKMQELGESKRIRLSKKVRTTLETKVRARAVVEFQEKNRIPVETKLAIHRPFKSDVELLQSEVNSSDGYYAFVSKQNFDKLLDMQEYVEKNRLVLIGTDPEFCLSNRPDDVCQYAANVLHDVHKIGKFGSDGPCAEIRPAPAATGVTLIKNMHDCFVLGKTINTTHKWLGGIVHKGEEGRTYTLGGQLHIGEPNDNLVSPKSKYLLRPLIIRILDEVLGIPLTRFEGADGVMRRTSSAYGKWGDFRVSKNRFEWRSVSAAWLLSPALTETVIELAAGISDYVYRRLIDEKVPLEKQPQFQAELAKELLVLSFSDASHYNNFLVNLGNTRTQANTDYKRVLDNLTSLPARLGLHEIEHEFGFLRSVADYQLADFRPEKDLRKV